MKGKRPYLVLILLSLAAGGLSGVFTMRGLPAYALLEKPPLTPPAAVFPVVWTALYILMGAGAARAWLSRRPGRERAMALFFAQLLLNALWSAWFFGLQARLFALAWLLVLLAAVARMIRAFAAVDRAAAWMQLPYFAWCLFAAYLNAGFWLLNR